jgi:hypothetical protein
MKTHMGGENTHTKPSTYRLLSSARPANAIEYKEKIACNRIPMRKIIEHLIESLEAKIMSFIVSKGKIREQ